MDDDLIRLACVVIGWAVLCLALVVVLLAKARGVSAPWQWSPRRRRS